MAKKECNTIIIAFDMCGSITSTRNLPLFYDEIEDLESAIRCVFKDSRTFKVELIANAELRGVSGNAEGFDSLLAAIHEFMQ